MNIGRKGGARERAEDGARLDKTYHGKKADIRETVEQHTDFKGDFPVTILHMLWLQSNSVNDLKCHFVTTKKYP